jgi:hypothetical protein
VWHQLPGGHWASEAVTIDMEEKLRSLDTGIIPHGRTVWINFRCSGDASNAVLLHITSYSSRHPTMHIVLDLETKEILMRHQSTSSSVLLEVDMLSKLQAMKVFP